MKIIKIISLFICALLLNTQVFALNDSENKALSDIINKYVSAFNKGDMHTVVSLMPKPHLKQLAGFFDKNEKEMAADMVNTNKLAIKMFDDDTKYKLTVDKNQTKVQKSTNGRIYIAYKSSLEGSLFGKNVLITNTLMAVQDQDKWWLLSMSNQADVDLFMKAFDDVKSVKFFPSKSIQR